MDIKMPVMDGLTATKIIRETDSEVIIIAQTAYINDRDIAIECGCTDFIAKPFGKITFLNLINSYI
jgi:CheY-like chemotaxis protein